MISAPKSVRDMNIEDTLPSAPGHSSEVRFPHFCGVKVKNLSSHVLKTLDKKAARRKCFWA